MIFPALAEEKKRDLVRLQCQDAKAVSHQMLWLCEVEKLLHAQTDNPIISLRAGWGHQPEQLQIGFTILNTVDLTGSCPQTASLFSLNEKVLLDPHGCWRGTMTSQNINELFDFGRIFMFSCTDCRHSSISQFSEQFHASLCLHLYTSLCPMGIKMRVKVGKVWR